MKRKYVIGVILFTIFNNNIILAEDGTLKIDAQPSQKNKTENYYYEQESELTSLFSDSLNKTISEKQEKESLSYEKDKTLIFNDNKKKDTVAEQYTKYLFPSSEKSFNRDKLKISIKERKEIFDWRTSVLLIISFLFMVISLSKVLVKKRRKL